MGKILLTLLAFAASLWMTTANAFPQAPIGGTGPILLPLTGLRIMEATSPGAIDLPSRTDAKFVAVPLRDPYVGYIRENPGTVVYERGTWKEIRTLRGERAEFSPNGGTLVVVDPKTKTTTLYDTESWRERKFFGENDFIKLSADGSRALYLKHQAAAWTLYDTATWTELRSLEKTDFAFFSPDGNIVVACNFQINRTRIYDAKSGNDVRTFEGGWGRLDWGGRILWIDNGKAGTTTAYGVGTWEQVKSFSGSYAVFSPDGKTALVKHRDGAFALYDAGTWKEIRTFKGDSFTSKAYSADSGTVLIYDKGAATSHVHDLRADRDRTVKGSAFFSPDGRTILSKDKTSSSYVLYDTSTVREIKSLKGGYASFSPDGGMLIVGSSDNKTLAFYDASTWKEILTLQGKFGAFNAYLYNRIFSPDGKWLAVSGILVSRVLDKPEALFRKGDFETTREYEDRLRSWSALYLSSIALNRYDADRGVFEADLAGHKLFVQMPREKAREVMKRKDRTDLVHAEGILRYANSGNLRLTDIRFVDKETDERFAVLHSLDSPAAYASQPLRREASADNIGDIPDFKAGPRPDDLAVVIGIERSRGLPVSEFSGRDAGLVKDYLRALGFPDRNIEALADERATKTDIEKALEAWLPNRVKISSRVFVYYSGHGAPDPTTGEAYIVPYDGDPNYLTTTGYPLKRLYEKLGRLRAAEVAVVLDSCFSGAGGRSVLARGARPLVMTAAAPVAAGNMAVLSATQGAQISTSAPDKGHGVFTYYFLKALKEGKRNLAEIYETVRPQVEDEAKRINVQQSPSLHPAPEKLTGRFFLRP